MKKTILFLFAIALFASCDRGDTPDDRGQLDPNAMILLRPDASVRAQIDGLSALEIVEQAATIRWQSYYTGNMRREVPQQISRGFTDAMRDFDIPALKMLGIDIINPQGGEDMETAELYRDFIFGFDVFITNAGNDTIAYVSNAVINAARPLVIAAFNDENFTEVYRLFDEAFTFRPIAE